MTLDRLREVLTGTVPNSIMPLFWQKGGPVERVREEMERIGDAGIDAVIVEARPHPEFLQDGWWRDVDAILEIARRRGMKVWFFDDDIFPTGHAAGAVLDAAPELRRRFIQERHTDVVGPMIGASLLVDRKLPWSPLPQQGTGAPWRVLAYPRAEDSVELIGDPIDLTDRVIDGTLQWDIPRGWWRVFFLSIDTDCGSERQIEYIDYLNGASTQLLIDSVYERTYERYSADFGTTIAGFFSDEPGIYNDPDTFDFASQPGKPSVPLPWNDEVAAQLTQKLGTDATALLPLLWWPAGDRERAVRYTFMDVVSQLYSTNFSRKLGDWCRAHGVEYIGHVIEDNGAHAHLGPGAGHYFRAMAGQDMAGIDVIGGQVIPGFSRGPFGNISGAADGEFFHFGLAKLASSAAHLDPLKRGRSVCETIGAYGWYAGLRLFTWLTNHLLVRGITHVVPHSFSPAEFPDPDCPPHFYAGGNNPQYRHQKLLSAYTNRLSHLLQGGRHIASFAVLYHADAEWLGRAMPVERPLRLLMEAQFDADIIPADSLPSADGSSAPTMSLGGEDYDALIIPGSSFLPEHVAEDLLRLDSAGVPVVFVDEVPRVIGTRTDALRERFRPVPQEFLAKVAGKLTTRAVQTSTATPSLRVYRIAHGDADIVMLFNESPTEAVHTTVTVPRGGEVVAVDAFAGSLEAVTSTAHPKGTLFDLELSPGAAMVAIVGAPAAWDGLPVRPQPAQQQSLQLTPRWRLSTATATEYPAFTDAGELSTLGSLSEPDLLPRFSGTVRYETSFSYDPAADGIQLLDLGEVYEIAQVRLNDIDLGTRIAPPYVYTVPAGVLAADNELAIEVTNTLAKAQRDPLSAFAQQEPAGLLGPVYLREFTPDPAAAPEGSRHA